MIPRVPVRHWVLGVPASWRARLADDPRQCRSLAANFVDAVLAITRLHCDELPAADEVRGGAASVVHRFGARLDVNVHVHVLALDGVYIRDHETDVPRFIPAAPPTDGDMHRIADQLFARFSAKLHSRKVADARGRPLSAAQLAKSMAISHENAAGPTAAKLDPRQLARALEPSTPARSTRRFPAGHSVDTRGVHVHSSPQVDGRSRRDVLDLCRYLQRSPIDWGRLDRSTGHRYIYRLPRPFHDGTVAIEFSPEELVDTLQRLVTPRQAGRVRFHGVLAPRAAERWFPRPSQLALPWQAGALGPRSAPDRPTAATQRDKPALHRAQPSPADLTCTDCGTTMLPTHVEESSDDEIPCRAGAREFPPRSIPPAGTNPQLASPPRRHDDPTS